MRSISGIAGAAIVAAALGGCATHRTVASGEWTAGGHYVAMGSSFASGPGLTPTANTATDAARCARSSENYAQQLATRLELVLTDVSCSGAKIAHLLGPWGALAPQVDALRADTQLVTVTIGGNDIGYIGGLLGASCHALGLAAQFTGLRCGPNAPPDASVYPQLADELRALVAEIRRRSPRARLVLVDYLAVLPPQGRCDLTPLSDADADIGRAVAARLAQLTADVARETGADLLSASRLSRGHDACAREPWTHGFAKPPAGFGRGSYHPNLAGMTAIAAALERQLRAR